METLNKDEAKIKKIDQFMDEILKDHPSLTKKQIYLEYEDAIDEIKPLDLFYLEMYRQETKYSVEEIMQDADKFVNVFHQRLEKYEIKEYKNNFFKSLYLETVAINNHLESLKPLFKNKKIIENKDQLLKGFEKCLEVERKFLKKENILFPHLEKTIPSTKPLEVMWALHDAARKTLREILTMLKQSTINEKEITLLIGKYYYTLYGINQKEQLILYPVAIKLLDETTLNKMFNESHEYGYAMIEVKHQEIIETVEEGQYSEGVFKTKTGTLEMKELAVLLNYLPLDITFVDKDDKVKYFNNRKARHFPRNPSIIGRLVKHCHPPKSVKIVEEIVDSFKQGKKDVEEFWITFNNVMLYITYYALRDKENNYMGVLEVSQDVTHIRNLKGEKRLL